MSKKPRGKPFPKGVSGNPKGRPKNPPEYNAIVNLIRAEFADVGKLLTMTHEELDQILAQEDMSVLKTILIKKFKKEDLKIVLAVLDRILPKPRETIDLNADVKLNSNITKEQMKRAALQVLDDD